MNENYRSPKIATFKKFGYAFKGLWTTLKEEKSFMIEVIIAFATITIGILLNLSIDKWPIIILTIGFVISSELLNTAVENVVDMVAFKYNLKAEKIKNISAAATLIFAIASLIVGLIIFIPQIVGLANGTIQWYGR